MGRKRKKRPFVLDRRGGYVLSPYPILVLKGTSDWKQAKAFRDYKMHPPEVNDYSQLPWEMDDV